MECQNHKSHQIPDTKRKRKESQTITLKTNKRTRSTQTSLSSQSEVIAMLKGLKRKARLNLYSLVELTAKLYTQSMSNTGTTALERPVV